MHHMTKTSTPLPSKPVRLTISVAPEVHEVFSRLAAAGSMSLSRAMGEWLGDTVDAAAFTAAKLEEARSAPRLVAQEMHAYALGLTDETGQVLRSVRQRAKSEGADRGAPRRHQSAPNSAPPPCNTGGKVPRKGAR